MAANIQIIHAAMTVTYCNIVCQEQQHSVLLDNNCNNDSLIGGGIKGGAMGLQST